MFVVEIKSEEEHNVLRTLCKIQKINGSNDYSVWEEFPYRVISESGKTQIYGKISTECAPISISVGAFAKKVSVLDKKQVWDNHLKLLSHIGATKTYAEKELRMVFNEVKKRKDLMIGLSIDDAGKFSYARNRADRTNPRRRVKTSLGKIIKRLDLPVEDHLIADVVSAITAKISGDGIVEYFGKDIGRMYVHLHENGGAQSCMSHNERDTELYQLNPERVRLLVYANRARALLWKTDCGRLFLDRIYFNGDRSAKEALINYARSRGAYIRNDYVENLPEDDVGDTRFTVTLKTRERFPYLDSFRYADEVFENDETVFTNFVSNYVFDSVDGGWSGVSACCCCGNQIEDGYSEEGPDGDTYCCECFNERYRRCMSCNEPVLIEDSVHVDEYAYCDYCADRRGYSRCEGCDENFWDDDMTHLDDRRSYCDRCDHVVVQCKECGEPFHEDDLEEHEGYYYCSSCGVPEEEEREALCA